MREMESKGLRCVCVLMSLVDVAEVHSCSVITLGGM